jgi:hypothetical protein
MLRRRLTALLASLVLMPSTVVDAGMDCVMGDPVAVGGAVVSADRNRPAHDHGHEAHRADTGALVNAADPDSPVGIPHAPAQCVLAAGCGAAAIAATTIALGNPTHVGVRVEGGAALVPDSPAPRIEPPPPRV